MNRQLQAYECEVVRKIINDEQWLEGERRGCCVAPDDPAVVENITAVILRVGQQMRQEYEQTHESNPDIQPS